MLNNNKIKIIYIILIFFLIIFFENCTNITYTLNENSIDLEYIIKIVEKFLDPNNAPILNKEEKLIAEYWNETLLCPFSKLISHKLTKEEALLIIEFFNITNLEDLEKLKIFIENYKK